MRENKKTLEKTISRTKNIESANLSYIQDIKEAKPLDEIVETINRHFANKII